jgi:hypothetical protein
MAESNPPATLSSNSCPKSYREFTDVQLVLASIANTLHFWLDGCLAEFAHRLARSIGGFLQPGF